MAKLKGGTKVQEDKVNRPPCKWLVNHYCNHPLLIHTGVFKLCLGCKYHEVEDIVPNDDKERVPCKWLRKRCDYANPWTCANPALKSRMKLKDIDHCLGCSIYEPCNVNDKVSIPCKWLHNDDTGLYCANPVLPDLFQVVQLKNSDHCLECKLYELQDVNDMSKDTELQCKHLLDNSHCANMDGSECPFVSMWDKWVIAGKMCKHYEFNIRYEVHVLRNSTSIIGVFKTREQAEQFIRDNVKVVEMIV